MLTREGLEALKEELGIRNPVTLVEEDEKIVIAIPRADGGRGERYGTVFDDNGNLKVQINPKPNSGLFGVYNKDNVASVSVGPLGQIYLGLTDGQIRLGIKTPNLPKDFDPQTPPPGRYASPPFLLHRYLIYKNWPYIEDYIRFNLLSMVPEVNTRFIFGGDEDEWEVYQGVSSPFVTAIMSVLEKERQFVTKKGVEYEEYFRPKPDSIDRVIEGIAWEHKINPFIEELLRVEWDGEERIDTLLSSIGGYARGVSEKDQKDYLAIVMRALLVSVLERNLKPMYDAIQFMLVLVGPQNARKSAFVKRLSFAPRFFKDTSVSPRDIKRFYEATKGGILTEIIEGVSFQELNPAEIKALIDTVAPQIRWAYAKNTEQYVIRYSMVMTTNEEMFSQDATGNRRIFPVCIVQNPPKTMYDYTDDEIWQIWAEALYRYDLGERWSSHIFGPDGAVRKMFAHAQADITAPELGGAMLRDYFDRAKPNIGDIVTEDEIRDYLDAQERVYFSDIEKIVSGFTNHSSGYGFEKVSHPYKYRRGLKYTSTRKAWKRVVPPLYEGDE